MKVAAYCRVSIEYEDQTNSFETQKFFFKEHICTYSLSMIPPYFDIFPNFPSTYFDIFRQTDSVPFTPARYELHSEHLSSAPVKAAITMQYCFCRYLQVAQVWMLSSGVIFVTSSS